MLLFIKELKSILFSFLWDNKQPLVNRNIVTLPKAKGGLNMLDVENHIKVMQIKWVNAIIRANKERWNILPKYWLDQYNVLNDMKPPLITMCCNLKNFDLGKIPEFYCSAIKTWSAFLKERTIKATDDILAENLFNNDRILEKNKTLHLKNWIKSGIAKIKDIWDTDKKTWKPENFIRDTLLDKSNWIVETLLVKKSIPIEWKQILTGEKEISNLVNAPKILITVENTVCINGKTIEKTKNKQIHDILQKNHPVPRCEQHWNNNLNKNLEWPKIWQNLITSKMDRKIKQFLWKCIYEVINTGARLRKMGKGNGKCQLCKNDDETQTHLFLHCEKLGNVPNHLRNLIMTKLDLQTFNLDKETLLTGFCPNLSEKQNNTLLKMIGSYKWNVWKRRNNFIFENKTETPFSLYKKIESHLR